MPSSPVYNQPLTSCVSVCVRASYVTNLLTFDPISLIFALRRRTVWRKYIPSDYFVMCPLFSRSEGGGCVHDRVD